MVPFSTVSYCLWEVLVLLFVEINFLREKSGSFHCLGTVLVSAVSLKTNLENAYSGTIFFIALSFTTSNTTVVYFISSYSA